MATSGFSYGKSAAELNVLLYLWWLGVGSTPLKASLITLAVIIKNYMYKYLSIILLFFTSIVNSQINSHYLTGEWIKINNRMVDGSKNISESFSSSKFYMWKISNKKLCMDSQPINSYEENCLDYNLENNFIRTSLESGYEITKLTSDTLIVVQRIKGINENDKLEKLWFVKSSIIKNNYINKHKNDSILIANEHFTPTLNKNFINDIHKNFIKRNKYPNFNLIGNIIFYPKQRKLEIEIINSLDENVIENKKAVDFIKSTIEKTFDSWALNDFKNFTKIYIPFLIKSESYKYKGVGYKGSPIFYFINNVDDVEKIYGIKMEDLRSSGENFQNGIIAYEDKKYEKAIDFFMKSYKIDSRKIDALYNIVAIYSLLNDKINMCECLKKLKDLEQTEGTKQYNENCLN
jgi:tetratricopeptide (TPR) repeat protein